MGLVLFNFIFYLVPLSLGRAFIVFGLRFFFFVWIMDTITFVNDRLSLSGDRPYGCDICDAKFTQVGDMRRHKKIHTGTDYLNKSKGKEKS